MIQQSGINQSASLDISLNRSIDNSHLLNNSLVQNSRIEEPSLAEIVEETNVVSVNLNVLQALKIEDILRALTSKIYKHQTMNNY